jgi:NAD(P)-dependent dehydrogenase (short-subunit alcohol dehydrogenase family)
MGDMSGSIAVVTGGARGIGRACALRLASLGARVAVVDRNLDGAKEFGEELGAASVEDELHSIAGEAMALESDLSKAGAADDVIQAVVDRWGRLDVLVAIAGGALTPYERSAASQITDEDLSTLISANLLTTVTSCRAAVPHMRGSGGGAIVTMGAVSGLKVVDSSGRFAAYAMLKAAIIQYSRYLATEVGPWNIRVNCVAPGAIRTARMVSESTRTGAASESTIRDVPLGRLGEVSDVADTVQFLVSPMASYVTGQVIVVNGGSMRL